MQDPDEKLARYLWCAYMSYFQDMNFDYYYKNFISGQEIPKYWIQLAKQVQNDMDKIISNEIKKISKK